MAFCGYCQSVLMFIFIYLRYIHIFSIYWFTWQRPTTAILHRFQGHRTWTITYFLQGSIIRKLDQKQRCHNSLNQHSDMGYVYPNKYCKLMTSDTPQNFHKHLYTKVPNMCVCLQVVGTIFQFTKIIWNSDQFSLSFTSLLNVVNFSFNIVVAESEISVVRYFHR